MASSRRRVASPTRFRPRPDVALDDAARIVSGHRDGVFPAVADDPLFDVDGTGRLFAAARLRDAGIADATDHADDWWRRTVDQAIRALAETGKPFVADDVRERVPDPPPGTSPNAFGGRFYAASRAGLISLMGYRRSTRPESRRRPVSVWKGAGS
jgi:hypothetical protein